MELHRAALTASHRPRVLFVVNACWFFVSHRLPLAEAARRAGFDVHVAAASDHTVPELALHGVTFHAVPFSRRGRNPLGELQTAAALVRVYRRVRPHLVHHVTIKPILYGGLAARLTGVPAVVHAVSGLGYTHLAAGPLARLFRSVLRNVYRISLGHANQTVIFQNDDDRNEFVSNGLVAPKQTVMIRGSGVDPAVFAPGARPEGVPLVVLPSRLLLHKGVAEFVEAARLLRARGVRARFALVGEADPHNPATVTPEQLEEWGAEGVVEVWGQRSDMPAVLRSAHVACLPSYREGLPKVLLEAAATGLPIVTTDVPGCRDVVRDGDNGLLVPPRDAHRLADALEAVLRDPARAARMGARGRERVMNEFTVGSVAAQTLQVYYSRLASLRIPSRSAAAGEGPAPVPAELAQP